MYRLSIPTQQTLQNVDLSTWFVILLFSMFTRSLEAQACNSYTVTPSSFSQIKSKVRPIQEVGKSTLPLVGELEKNGLFLIYPRYLTQNPNGIRDTKESDLNWKLLNDCKVLLLWLTHWPSPPSPGSFWQVSSWGSAGHHAADILGHVEAWLGAGPLLISCYSVSHVCVCFQFRGTQSVLNFRKKGFSVCCKSCDNICH